MNSQGCSPTGENRAMFNGMKMNKAPIANSLKNQLRLRITASYFATVPALCRNDILL